MIEYRAYRNCDAPAVASIWQAQPPSRALFSAVTPALLEQRVFSKPYFDREGLILAWEGEQAIGFVHAGFCVNEDQTALNKSTGIIFQLLVGPHACRNDIAIGLMEQAESYLRAAGSNRAMGGAAYPHHAFYLGLYGGSELPGILLSDGEALERFRSQGYGEKLRTITMQKELASFRPAFDRKQMQIRRKYKTSTIPDPMPATWWEACNAATTQQTRFELHAPTGERCASVTYWNIEPLSSSWGLYAMGLSELEVDESCRRQGIATFLVSETLRQIQSQGVSLVEVQMPADNEAAISLYRKLGFREVDYGIVFEKEL